MSDTRKKHRSLTGTRIYIRDGQYKYLSPTPFLNPTSGKIVALHTLCPIKDGELAARDALRKLLGTTDKASGQGDFCAWIGKWREFILLQRNKKAPKDPARLPTFAKGTKNITSAINVIEKGFADFDVVDVKGFDVAQFLDQWSGKRVAQVYRSYLVRFFEWCISRHGLIDINPAMQISVVTPPKRKVYITDKQFLDIRDFLLINEKGKKIRGGEMIQCYVDLLYLLFQRGTDIRLMRKDEIKEDGISVEPTKTEDSSGMEVKLPLTDEIKAVLERIKAVAKMRSIFVIHTAKGQPFTASGVRTAFSRAAVRAGVKGVTLKDIRAKAASDAKKQGYSMEQIQVALAHTDQSTTRGYVRDQAVPISAIVIALPKR